MLNYAYFRSKSTDLFYGASQQAFPKEIIKILMAPINSDDIEIKPDGMCYRCCHMVLNIYIYNMQLFILVKLG